MERKYFIIILAFLSFVLCIFFIEESYAKYISSARENAEMSVARWRILVNNNDIRNESSTFASLTPVFPGNENIAAGIIAPTSEGYFDLIIDATDADVSFRYTISFSVNESSSVKDLVVFKYTINDGEPINIEKDKQIIENAVLQANNTEPIKLRVFVVWDDGEGSSMDNSQDTEATKSGIPAKMDVNLSFIQLK